MKSAKIIASFLVCFIVLFSSLPICQADVYVQGYFRKNGTYVAPHYRSDPDHTPRNNWSYKGNVNPRTGEIGHKREKNYYHPVPMDNSMTRIAPPIVTAPVTLPKINDVDAILSSKPIALPSKKTTVYSSTPSCSQIFAYKPVEKTSGETNDKGECYGFLGLLAVVPAFYLGSIILFVIGVVIFYGIPLICSLAIGEIKKNLDLDGRRANRAITENFTNTAETPIPTTRPTAINITSSHTNAALPVSIFPTKTSPSPSEKFVQVTFDGYYKHYDYYLGNHPEINIGDMVEVYVNRGGEIRTKAAKVVYISDEGERSDYARSEVVRKLTTVLHGNPRSKKYHKSWCRQISNMSDYKQFATEDEAKQLGYMPCAKCCGK